MKWWPSECAPGDMIRIQIGSIYHYGIFVSEKEVIQFGEPPTASLIQRDNSAVRVCSTDIDAFSCGHIVEVAQLDRKEKRKRFPPAQTVLLARRRIGQGGYNLIHNNCEHFVYECVFGVKKSTQEDEARKRWSERPVFDVYLQRIPEKCLVFPVETKKREAEIRHTKDARQKIEKYAAWKLLQFGAHETYGYNEKDIKYRRGGNGKWACDEFYFSIAHSNGLIAVVISEKPVGIDVENIPQLQAKYDVETRRKMLEDASTPEEREAVVSETLPLSFASFWTKKESTFKMLDRKSFRPAELPLDENTLLSARFSELGDFCLSVCGDDPSRAVFWLCDEHGNKRYIKALSVRPETVTG